MSKRERLVFKLDRKGVREMLKGPEMMDAIKQTTNAIQSRCGHGYFTSTKIGRNRALGMVYAGTYEAKLDNSENNTLLKALR